MTASPDALVAALRTHHDDLAALVPGLTHEQLTGPSGASEWSVAQVLSHLGSGSEIMLAPFQAAVGGPTTPVDAQAVWARWDAMEPEQQAVAFLEHDERLVAALEATDAEQRGTAKVDLGFLPEPVPLATALGMRLNEVAAHAWDVHVGIDPAAELDPTSAGLLALSYAGGLGFLLGFSAKTDRLGEPVRLGVPGYTVVLDDSAHVVEGAAEPTAELDGSLSAAVRLLTGRLTPAHTPDGVTVTGNTTLEELRRVFPGY